MSLPNPNPQPPRAKPWQYSRGAKPLTDPIPNLASVPACPVAACHSLILWGFGFGLIGQVMGSIGPRYPKAALGLSIPILVVLLWLLWITCHNPDLRVPAALRLTIAIIALVVGA